MPPAPSEPENYTIDEMLERLKAKSSEDPATAGELVTRADGTQAVRVRRHKRRSEQPQRNEAKRLRRTRVIKVSAALVFMLLIGLVIGFAYVYANTAPYRKFITETVANSLGANVDFKLFRISPASANLESVALGWPEGNALKSIQLRGVTANISPLSLLGTSLRGDEVSAREATLCLQTPNPGSPLLATAANPNSPPAQFNRISVSKFNATVGNPSQPAFKIISAEASLHFDKVRKETTLRLYRGNLQITGWPVYEIDRAVMEFHGPETELIALRIVDSQFKHGLLGLAGTLRPFTSDSPTSLTVKLDGFDLGALLGQDLGELISGQIDTRPSTDSNIFSFVPGSSASTKLDIAFKNALTSKISIKGFPFLLALIRTLNDKWYENPSFVDDSTGIIHRDMASLEIRDLKLESKSRMAIKANLTVTPDKALTGSMQVGLPESVIELSQNPIIGSMLTPAHDGFRWFTLKISGTLTRPSDNFVDLYNAAKGSASDNPEESTTPVTDPEKSFDKITRPKGP